VVIIYSCDYIDLFDYYYFLLLIYYFHVAMLLFVYCNDYLLALFYWELLGLSSYLLLNFWSNKNHCGIMALLYNKIGDILMLYSIGGCYYILSSTDMELILLLLVHYHCYYPTLLLSIILTFTTKSAQYIIIIFFTTYLCNINIHIQFIIHNPIINSCRKAIIENE
jgi:NADH:ubiquinone oxidoreductase subunit 5 (subunit L)/multisubunit Na+/H+ antiporter MnhA subunit